MPFLRWCVSSLDPFSELPMCTCHCFRDTSLGFSNVSHWPCQKSYSWTSSLLPPQQAAPPQPSPSEEMPWPSILDSPFPPRHPTQRQTFLARSPKPILNLITFPHTRFSLLSPSPQRPEKQTLATASWSMSLPLLLPPDNQSLKLQWNHLLWIQVKLCLSPV